jgi:hypothetical protein
MHLFVWLYRSPGNAFDPSGAIGAVPATEIMLPILTALENPIGFSKAEPDEMLILSILIND